MGYLEATHESGGGQYEGNMTDAPLLKRRERLPREMGHVGTLGARGHQEDITTSNSTCKGLEGNASCAGARGERAKEGQARSLDEVRLRGTRAHGEAHRGQRL